MYSRLIKPNPNKSFFLFGPRGTGKTTWVKNNYPQAIYLDLLDSHLFTSLLTDPSRLITHIPPHHQKYVVIDEIQRVPELLNQVHKLIEEQNLKFILTGSNARKLRAQGVNLLAGRAYTYYLHPLTAIELGKNFDLTQALKFGLMPSISQETNPQKYLASYIQTYLEQEIYQEGFTRNLSAFARFLETASFSQGSTLSISNVARDANVERKTVENYFTILEDLLIAYKLPTFHKRAKRRLVTSPKFYFFDTGVYRSIRPTGPLDSSQEISGVALETLFFQNLLAINQALELDYDLYYYRTATGVEVDFIAYGKKRIFAFEIKHSDRFNPNMLKGLKHFQADYPMVKLYLIYQGQKTLYRDGITILPATKALMELDKILEN
ncbi:ATP-binding protein [Patescibacteria group bacterium]|nr:ATP-binding protein [Patescibacteria group bacterium]MBU1885126.1 ATP-binding protein [Patescibacteria group bacterium]